MATPGERNAPITLSEADILKRGLEAFAELGYEGASVRVLARRLGVSHNFINVRFGSKGKFWRAVVDAAMTSLRDDLVWAADKSLPDDQLLRGIVFELFRHASKVPEVNRIIADESARESDRLDYINVLYIQPFFTVLEPILRRLMVARQMPDAPLEVVFAAINGSALALTHDPLVRRLGISSTPGRSERAELMARLLLDGLLPRTTGAAV
ncbi:TetR/AcrR family transcriptional regulator [Actinoplanes sp. TBRC 11911]|uniref:TetR/AcrR family transcriptional regulator n=1 Tax=Actinoplanes sp. TBRC 11911 TaxID=2729386 RepID=UPI00145F67BE|nr:TetR/AcrR family transcriptional regulator [Actinoplanes sp. TBRC 11911]NMO55399.1 TetR/AcrR family transcriptional regulator [Actinoplanes sp. TBRC 11911]